MGYRNIVVSSAAHLSVQNEQLNINEYAIPLEDINDPMI